MREIVDEEFARKLARGLGVAGDSRRIYVADDITWSIGVNLGILVTTALVGILSWLGARQSATKAQSSHEKATAAATRSASAAQDSADIHARMLELEQLRQAESTLDAKRAKLHAEKSTKDVWRFDRPDKDTFLTITNSGQSAADKLEIQINGKPVNDYKEFIQKLSAGSSAGASGRLDLMMTFFMSGELVLPFDVTLAWDDESGIRGRWSGTIT